MGFFGPIQNNFGDTEGPNLLSGPTILDTPKPIWTGTAPEEMVQNVKLSCEKLFLVRFKTFWTSLKTIRTCPQQLVKVL